jgi:DNA-binding response OmpR family regulator
VDVAIVHQRPSAPGWVEPLQHLFQAKQVGSPTAGTFDVVVLHGRREWVRGWIDRGGVRRGTGVIAVLAPWSLAAATEMLRYAVDDVVRPTVGGDELAARICAIVRRSRAANGNDEDPPTRLRPMEQKLLDYFCAFPGRVIPQAELFDNVFSTANRNAQTSLARVHISRLRRHLGPSATLRTIRGLGYVFERFEAPRSR